MKRQIQKTGVRKFFGQDFVDLQAEPLKALDAFFAEYGACLIEGCAITEADGGTFHVAPGLVALESTDPESGVVSVRTMPFAGAKGVALPLYLVAEWTVVERAYGDGKVKPIGYNLLAVASGIALGQTVEAGAKIAEVGGAPSDKPNCGASTGAHLHLGVLRNSVRIDPLTEFRV